MRLTIEYNINRRHLVAFHLFRILKLVKKYL